MKGSALLSTLFEIRMQPKLPVGLRLDHLQARVQVRVCCLLWIETNMAEMYFVP